MPPSLLHIVSFFEFVYTAACINELLLACKERVAFVADIHLERIHVFGGTRFERFAASAYNRNLMIFRMYIGLHFFHLAKVSMLNHYISFCGGSQSKIGYCKTFSFIPAAKRPCRKAHGGRRGKNFYNLVAFAAVCEYN